jgi:hypothetical protein
MVFFQNDGSACVAVTVFFSNDNACDANEHDPVEDRNPNALRWKKQ